MAALIGGKIGPEHCKSTGSNESCFFCSDFADFDFVYAKDLLTSAIKMVSSSNLKQGSMHK